ncbi:MAG TPA: vitamin K epoxide reductase family protein [Abditibacteriaceae bacterium]|nr:vitamin K epoxide reductase family protein [Abditibacteriaceae bacterium]
MESTHEVVVPGAAEVSPRSSLRVSWPHLVLGVIGAAISFYTILLHHKIKASNASGACGVGDCDDVIGSQYGEMFGIPVGAFGVLFFAVIILLSIVTKASSATARQIAVQRLLVASAGLVSSLAFTYISLAIIRKFCPYCMATHTTTLLIFIVSLVGYLKVRRMPQSSSSSAL